MVGFYDAVFRHHARALDEREQVALDAAARDIGSRRAIRADYLIEFVYKYYPCFLRACLRSLDDIVHIEQLVYLLLQQLLSRL